MSYILMLSSILFIVGLKMLCSPETAAKGNIVSSAGMLLAVAATVLYNHLVSNTGLLIGVSTGAVIGLVLATTVEMTRMPELVALFNGLGGLSSLLVGLIVYIQGAPLSIVVAASMVFSIFIGGITFIGSIVAWFKLGFGRGNLRFRFQRELNITMLLAIIAAGVLFSISPTDKLFIAIGLLSLAVGCFAVLPIGGADMPVVISLLNSFSGLAASAAGFILGNSVLVVAGSLVGSSGIILTIIMCKAMNRSLLNVLFSSFGAAGGSTSGQHGEARAITAEDAYYVLEAADSVVIVPGYGLAVAQAQHLVRELGELMEANGSEVRYAIHPVAGRMPGHMNVLLSEANVSYDQLVEMDDINPSMELTSVCMVIGANDVVNPAARDDESSPIYGMPVINADKARTVFVLKRSMASGFAGIENPLFYKENTRMLFGDAKQTLQGLVAEFKKG